MGKQAFSFALKRPWSVANVKTVIRTMKSYFNHFRHLLTLLHANKDFKVKLREPNPTLPPPHLCYRGSGRFQRQKGIKISLYSISISLLNCNGSSWTCSTKVQVQGKNEGGEIAEKRGGYYDKDAMIFLPFYCHV